MTFKPALWYPIALVASVGNVLAAGFAIAKGEMGHAGLHAALAVLFGVWAQRLRQGTGGRDLEARLETLEGEVQGLRQELNEAHERLDFAERLLAQAPEQRRVGPER